MAPLSVQTTTVHEGQSKSLAVMELLTNPTQASLGRLHTNRDSLLNGKVSFVEESVLPDHRGSDRDIGARVDLVVVLP